MSQSTFTIETSFTKMMGCRIPIIGAPMFLVSNENMVLEVTRMGGLGSFPALNYRPSSDLRRALENLKTKKQGPIGVNLIVNKSNTRQHEDLDHCLETGVDLFITSLGNPKEVIKKAHEVGAKVLCDVTNLEHARKVQDLGADGVIAVAAGAGGHAGPTSPFVLIPWLKKELSIPVVAAGGIADGATFAAALALGADAVSVGTRFIACKEAQIHQDYKNAVVDSDPEDIVLTRRLSGTPASVINTKAVQKIGLELPWIVEQLKKYSATKKYVVPLVHWAGMQALKSSAEKPTWKTVWSAGQSVGLIQEELSCEEIMNRFISEYTSVVNQLKGTPNED